MANMDVFNSNAFSMLSMTAAIQDVPTVPSFLGSLNLFTPKPVRTTGVEVERRGKTLALIQSSERGSPRPTATRDRRTLRTFNTVRLAKTDKLMADEIQNIRAFGTESELEGVQAEIARRQLGLLDDLETTMEFHRLSAINGILLDADNSQIYDYFSEFGIAAPTEIAFDWANKTGVKTFVADNVKRPMIRALGGRARPGMRILALCGDTFYDAMQENAEYRATYLQTNEARSLRDDNTFETISAWGVDWVNYKGTDDNTTVAIADAKCKFIPVGVPDVFQVAYSPAEGFDYVNTLGLERYAGTYMDPSGRNEWVDIDVAGYPLHICSTPEALLDGRSGA